MEETVTIRDYTEFKMDEVLALYRDAGWKNYLERAYILPEAYKNSLCALGAFDGDRLVGFIRAVGDGVSIVFIQDIIISASWQRRGIGTRLMKTLLERYKGVYQIQLLTDDTEKTRAFYRALGFRAAGETGCVAFIKM